MKIVALVVDLMDRSRVSSALGEVEFARDVGACAEADVVVVDLAHQVASIADVRGVAPDARIVAFGPHVDADLLSRALADGADVALPRSRFFHDPAATLTP